MLPLIFKSYILKFNDSSAAFALAPRERDEAMMHSQLTFCESESLTKAGAARWGDCLISFVPLLLACAPFFSKWLSLTFQVSHDCCIEDAGISPGEMTLGEWRTGGGGRKGACQFLLVLCGAEHWTPSWQGFCWGGLIFGLQRQGVWQWWRQQQGI